MSIEALNEQLLRAVGVGIALFNAETLELQFCNQVFETWFDTVKTGESLKAVFPRIDQSAMFEAIDRSERYTDELQLRKKRRILVVSQTITRARMSEGSLLVVECQNITRIRELESMIDSYARMVERNTQQIEREKEQIEKLLLNIMPRAAYDEYKTFGIVAPQRYEATAVLVVGFDGLAELMDNLAPATFVSELNELYTSFDRIGEQFGCERIKTTGDRYLAIAGLTDTGADHINAVAQTALRLMRYIKRRNENAEIQWNARIGLGSGPVVGSVVGAQNYVYDVFGPAVNSALNALEAAKPLELAAGPGFSEAQPAGVSFEPILSSGQFRLAASGS